LTVDGSLSETGGVEYFANGVSLGNGAGANFQFQWSKVPAGLYSIFGLATERGVSGVTDETDAVLVYVAPSATPTAQPFFSSVVLEDGRVGLSMPTANGVSCSIEVTEDLARGVWSTLSDIVGDGSVKKIQVEIDSHARFFRIRSAP
jgi:hypothetical protein